jgi:hypothetical protein
MTNETINLTFNQSFTKISLIIYYLNTIIPLIWLVIGTISNLISLAVFSRNSMRRNSTFIYLAIMSFSDIITLWLSSFRDYLAYKFNIYINGDYPCKFHVFSFFVFAQFSSWLLVGANLDRLIVVISSNKYSQIWCSKRTALKFASTLLLIIVVINLHFLVFVESASNNHSISNSSVNSSVDELLVVVTVNPFVYPKCTLKNNQKYIDFYNKIFTWIDACLYCLLPFLIMLICNITLIKHVFKTKQNLLKKQSFKPKYSIMSLYRSAKSSTSNASRFSLKSQSKKTHIYKPPQTDSIERMRNMAITIISVTMLFILFTVPINVFIPITIALNRHGQIEDLIFSILNNMVNANHSINFFIYYITNSKFNKELKVLVAIMKNKIFLFLHISAEYNTFSKMQTSSNQINGNLLNVNTNTTNLTSTKRTSTTNTSKVHFSAASQEPSCVAPKQQQHQNLDKSS